MNNFDTRLHRQSSSTCVLKITRCCWAKVNNHKRALLQNKFLETRYNYALLLDSLNKIVPDHTPRQNTTTGETFLRHNFVGTRPQNPQKWSHDPWLGPSLPHALGTSARSRIGSKHMHLLGEVRTFANHLNIAATSGG